jgi:uncharacterized membrane protein
MFAESSGYFMTAMYYAAITLEAMGALVICIGVLATTGLFLYRSWKHQGTNPFYQHYRRGMGKAILLGLELLVAGDIILTITHNFDLRHISVLGLLVLIRTFLSFSLEIELNGHLPWRRPKGAGEDENYV